jgi:hypothetical protein
LNTLTVNSNISISVTKVEIRRLKRSGRGSKIHVFPCNRWLARDEEDRAIERDLVVAKIIDEKQSGESREREVRDKLDMKDYAVEVYTGSESGSGTNANVFLTMFGEFGDTGEKALIKSQNFDKFEKNQMDKFSIQAADLGKIFKVVVRHDNSGFRPDWFLDKIKVLDGRDSYVFVCERWLSKSKEDKSIERTLFEKVRIFHNSITEHCQITIFKSKFNCNYKTAILKAPMNQMSE